MRAIRPHPTGEKAGQGPRAIELPMFICRETAPRFFYVPARCFHLRRMKKIRSPHEYSEPEINIHPAAGDLPFISWWSCVFLLWSFIPLDWRASKCALRVRDSAKAKMMDHVDSTSVSNFFHLNYIPTLVLHYYAKMDNIFSHYPNDQPCLFLN